MAWLVALWVMVLPVRAAEPTTQPLLRLETGMHTAPIRRIATDREGRWAVTASQDKTARIWEVATGRLVGVLRPPQDEGDEGKLYPVAMSPDGTTVAVGGFTGHTWDGRSAIYLFDRASQQLRRRITGLPESVSSLAWSPDGRWLAAGLRGTQGIRLFDAVSGAEAGRDIEFKGASYSVEIGLSGGPGGFRLLSSSDDGHLRLHAVEANGALRLLKAVRPGGGERPYDARFSPDGRRVAVGFKDSPVVQVLDATDLREIARPDITGVDDAKIFSVAWSADGRSLVAAGSWMENGREMMRRWSVDDWRRLGDEPLADDSVMGLVALPARSGGGWLFAGSDPTWGVLTGDGRVRRRQDSVRADLRAARQEFQLAADGSRVRFGFRVWGKDPFVWNVGERTLTAVTGAHDLLASPRTEAPGLRFERRKDATSATLNGQPLKLLPYETSRSLAIAPDGQRFVLGADWLLRLFDRQGQPIWEKEVPGNTWAVNVSADSRWVVAGYGDGTIRWHQISDGKEVLAFFPHANRKDWVLWTPEGFYAASPGAEGLIGYHLNQGKDKEGLFVNASQLRAKFYQPDLVSRRLSPEGDALMADAVKALGDVRQLLAGNQAKPPVLRLEGAPLLAANGEVEVAVSADAAAGLERVIFRVGRPDGPEVTGRAVSPVGARVERRSFPVAPEVPKLYAVARDKRGIDSPPLEVALPARARATTPPALHVLAVGVSRYRDGALNAGVEFASADARSVAGLLERQGKRLFGEQRVKTELLVDERASADAISSTLERMAAAVQPQDVFVLYMAGHGRSDRANGYHFVPWEARFYSVERLLQQSLNEAKLLALLAKVASTKLVLLLDTCSSGAMAGRGVADKDAIDRLSRVAGRHTIAAVSAQGEAFQVGGHGAFTSVLLEGLAGKADKDGKNGVGVRELAEYIEEELPALTKKRLGIEQIPFSRLEGQTFILAPGR